MASTVTRHPLTQRNLAIHTRLLQAQQIATEKITSWAEEVIMEEQTQLVYSQLGASISDAPPNTKDKDIERQMDRLDQRISSAAATTDLESLKVFEQQRPFMYLETPVERFLTPGSSDPSYFSRPTLAHIGLRFGNMEGAKERADMARAHVKAIRDRDQAQDTSSR
ncbi:hypothetical protein BJY04DRAFT_219930 [Aspergillus karnatakaensis]|uniref:uncharacterized protein n=1 Tax=Aspergillus karnatakaensis TaxID=1810916 RepID=UPI003CCD3527